MVIITLLAAWPAVAAPLYGQTVGTLEMVCTVREDGEGLAAAKVVVFQDGAEFQARNTDTKGRVVFKLPYQHVYRIEFSKEKYVTKFIEVNAKLPKEESDISSSFKFDVRLFPFFPELDISALSKPVAKLAFDPGFGDFYYDMKYHKEVKDELKAVEDHALALAGQEQRKLELLYNKALAEADKSMANGDYANAKEAYTRASSIKPEEAYPKQKLAEIENLLKEQNGLRAKYDAAITKAEKELNAEKYLEAKASYQSALVIFPNEQLPKTKISEIDRILEGKKKEDEKEQAYMQAIKQADAAFAIENYPVAITEYKKALGIKPGEKHPTDRLAEIERLQAKQAELEASKKEEAYQKAMASGDEKRTNKQYDLAIAAYKDALNAKPGDAVATQKIKETEELKAKLDLANSAQKEKDQAYLNALAKGDRALKEKDYKTAREGYTEAKQVKPDEAYPQMKIDEIDKLLADQQALASKEAEKDKAYREAIAMADGLYNEKKYEDAKSAYQKALAIKPYEVVPKDRIKEIDGILAALQKEREDAAALKAKQDAAKKQQLEEEYRNTLILGDKAYGAKDYDKAITHYQKAMGMKPDDNYPKSQLAKIKELKDQAAQNKDTGPEKVKGKYADLGEGVHNMGTTKERNNTVELIVVVRSGVATEYKKVSTNYGVTYFYKGDNQITGAVFEQETRP
ncbi:MAG: hypothetical protein H6585_07765 [Flavobacteriales bacterium]|nr:hypothetical protein [Flavobacteriales bacterium]MCB9448223.1 hypothetical protein [Flavobacteriales bacterium]